MSRIGKLPIALPDGVNCVFKAPKVTVEGPKGKLERAINFNGKIKIDKGSITITSEDEEKKNKALYGLTRSLLNSMVIGVTEGFVKTLKIVGVGYKAQMQGEGLLLNLGHSHPIEYQVPEGVKIDVPDMNTVIVSGIDKQAVGQCAAEIHAQRKPEPYNGRGIKYVDEQIQRKQGKQFAGGAA